MFTSRRLSAIARRAYSQTTQNVSGAKPIAGPSSSGASVNVNVPGLSSNVVKPTMEPLGPGASPTGDYKVPEYYSFNRFSYAEAEVELVKYRLPQPSAQMKK
ncbi:NADH dehydrogenase [ubiquinone] flavoprotein 3, mitochondrial [Eurosta solidaginis]|uniref:NADH dehydrogenase [ubiquinone] flavoprotein 3, mitochondrial n=1 Tax=Eurosta solidaginis TaxID=178769 RepID=UPI0035305D52